MNSILRSSITIFVLCLMPGFIISQTPDLGASSSFAMFTAAGAFSNDGTTVVTGDIGTNVGAFTGFPPGIVIGSIHVADVISAQAAMDVATAYSDLFGLNCGMVLGTTLGGGQMLTPNVYCLGAASVLNGDLILDGQCDPDAFFIFKIDGALSTAVNSTVTLINGASLCNVYWQINGAVDLGEGSVFMGTIVAGGAITLLEGAALDGRGLTTAGAIAMHNNVVNNDMQPTPSTLVADGPTTFCLGDSVVLSGNCGGTWNTGATTASITVYAGGDFFVTTTNGCGLATSNHIIVTVHPLPVCTITGVFSLCPGQSTQLCSPAGYMGYAWSTGAIVNCITVNAVGTYSVTVTDSNGCTSACSQDVTFGDAVPPQIACPPNITIDCSASSLPANTGTASASDICDPAPVIGYVDVIVEGGCAASYSVTRTWTATDATGNSASCTQAISADDATAPVITCPAIVSPIECGAIPSFGAATATDACDAIVEVTFSDASTPGSCLQNNIVTRTWIATDDCGNTSSCSATISVEDNTPPVITCPTVTSPIECGATPSFGVATAIDACDASVTITFSDITVSGLCNQASGVTRTWTATDHCGNVATCSATIMMQDNTPPVITCPVVISPIECGTPISFGTPIVTDACDASVTVTFSDLSAPGFCTQEYSMTRTWVATDDCGNTSSCNATIIVQDNTPPVMTCPLVTSPIDCGSMPAFGAATAIDACDVQVAISFSDITVPGLCPQEYSVTRTWIATDDCGNSSTCSSTIIVQDNTAPVITCPIVVSPIGCGEIPAFGLATALDACDASVVLTFTDINTQGICSQEYSVTRTWTATDDCGNVASCSSTIVVGGSAGLVISCPPGLTVQCTESIPPIDISLIQASGNCGTLTITFVSDVITNQTCANNYTLTRTYQATDACGNSASCNQVIIVQDNTPPVITFINPDLGQPGDTMRVQCYGQDPEWDIPTYNANSVSATDICGGGVTVAYTHVLQDAGNCSADGYINLYKMTWTATDVCGNSSSAYVFLALVDTIPPVIHDVPDNVTVNCDDVPWPTTVYATDECLCACVVLFDETSRTLLSCQNGVVLTRSWTATDRCGNVTVETQRITLMDTDGPVLQIMQPEIVGITNGTILEYTCHEGGIPDFYDDLDAESVYSAPSCGGTAIISFKKNISIVNNCEFYGYIEQRTYQWQGIDACGNGTSLTILVRLIDNEAPVITGLPDTTCIGNPVLNEVDVVDNCEHPSLRFWDVNIPNPCGTGLAVRRTYEAFDNCGNMARDTVIMLPDLQTKPVLSFIDPEMALIDSGTVMTINCASHGAHYTNFDIHDVIVQGGCQAGTTVKFAETVLTSGDCSTNGIVAMLELKWTATDACGNFSQKILVANVVDESSPVFVDFSPVLSVGCHDSIPVMSATDNCGDVFMTMVDKVIPGTCANEYDIERTYTATDPCHNTTVRQQTIHVGNGGGPAIVGVELEICEDLTIPVVTAFDACADQFVDVTMVQDTLDITCRDGLLIQRTWSATDACGHTTVIHQVIVTHDLTAPEIYIPSSSVIYLFLDNDHNLVYQSQTKIMDKLNDFNDESVSVYDDCDQVITPVLTVDTIVSSDCQADGYAERRIYTWVATDVCGNSSSISFAIDIMDDMPPVFSQSLADTMIICAPMMPAADMVLVDTLEAVAIFYTEAMVPGPGAGQFSFTRTWVASDSCHNTATAVQHIMWQPVSALECSISLPELVQCNSHGVIITSNVIGGVGPYTYEWQIVGEKCFLQAGQGTPEIQLYMGWAPVKIVLTVTDRYGCVSMCMTFLNCVESADIPFAVSPGISAGVTMVEQGVRTEQSGPGGEEVAALSQFNLWPNPATETVNISFESGLEGAIECSFTNFLGQAILKDKMMVHKGFNTRQIDAATLPNGSYMLQVKTTKEMYSRLVVILRNE